MAILPKPEPAAVTGRNLPLSAARNSLLLGIPLFLYLALSLYQLHLPGLHYDEAFEAVPALQILLGQPVTAFRGSGLVINGQTWPFMTQDYIGALNTYLAIPFISLLGPTPAALRVMSALIGAVTLGLAYFLAVQLTGSNWAGLAAALLLAVDPTFVFWNRQGIFVTAVTACIGLAAALCWLRWLKSGSRRDFAAGAFLFGLGLYAKFLFIWLIAALLGVWILLWLLPWLRIAGLKAGRKFVIPSWNKLLRPLAVGLAAFLLGCWPLLAYNFQTGGTWLSISQNAATSYYGVNNLALGPNLLQRLFQFFTMLNGGHFWYLGQPVSNYTAPVLFGAGLGLVLYTTVTTRISGASPSLQAPPYPNGLSPSRAALFPFLVIGLVIVASIGTVSALWITHFAILMPWPAIALVTGGWFIWAAWERSWQQKNIRRWLFALIWAGWGLLMITQLNSTLRYHLALAESRGLSTHSDAVYDLSQWLDSHTQGPVVAMDWGLAAPVTYLTGGRVSPVEIFGYTWQSEADLTRQLQRFTVQPDTFYLWRGPEEIIFNRSSEFKALYRPLGLEETIEAAFYENSGRPILGVTRLVPCGTLNITPPDPSPYCP